MKSLQPFTNQSQLIKIHRYNNRTRYLHSDKRDSFQKNSNIAFGTNIDLNDFPYKKLGLVAEIGTFKDYSEAIDLQAGYGAFEMFTYDESTLLANLKRAMSIPGALLIVIKDKSNKIVACANLYGYLESLSASLLEPISEKIGSIDAVFVKKEYRHIGIASWMVNKLKEQAQINGMTELRLVAENKNAARLYEKLDFKNYNPREIGKDITPIDRGYIYMRHCISSN